MRATSMARRLASAAVAGMPAGPCSWLVRSRRVAAAALTALVGTHVAYKNPQSRPPGAPRRVSGSLMSVMRGAGPLAAVTGAGACASAAAGAAMPAVMRQTQSYCACKMRVWRAASQWVPLKVLVQVPSLRCLHLRAVLQLSPVLCLRRLCLGRTLSLDSDAINRK
jgi:hypothetical protein